MNNTVYVLVGISGAGKSTFIDKFLKTHPDVVVHTSDALRAVYGTGEGDQTVSGMVFSTIRYNVDRDLKSGKDVMIDATSLKRADRKIYIKLAIINNAKAVAYVLERDKETIMRNQQSRKDAGGRFVPENIIDDMFLKYKRPTTDEGFDQIILI